MPLFLTRWITHFCAPVFVFLAGAGAYLYGASGRSRGEMARFLLMRGLLLICMELVLINPLWMGSAWVSAGSYFAFLQVFWAIGWSMILLAAMVWLPMWAIAAVGLVVVSGHNLLDQIVLPGDPSTWTAGWRVWALTHVGGVFMPLGGGLHVLGMYPLIPWPGVMACGYAFGRMVGMPQLKRDRWMLGIGLGASACFVALRWSNLYGDLHPWTAQKRGAEFSLLSFLNCEKYPPSLCYLLMTLGPAISVLPLAERLHGRGVEALRVFGRVPLFFYLAHAVLLCGLNVLRTRLHGWPVGWELGFSGSFPKDYSPSLPWAYLVWIGIVAALYAPCQWYGDVKGRYRGSWWAKYF